jgi:hypothetical protein
VDLDWAGADAGQIGDGVPSAAAPNGGAGVGAYLTDEEILGIEPAGKFGNDNAGGADAQQNGAAAAGGPVEVGAAKNTQADASHSLTTRASATEGMPPWMAAVAADPKSGAEAQQLWREHQEFRAAFASPEEARAIKELLPGGVKDVLSLRDATQSVDRIDAAIFSGDVRAQSEVAAELARANPAAFRSMFAEAAKVLASLGAGGPEAGGRRLDAGIFDGAAAERLTDGPTLRENGEGWGTQNRNQNQNQDQNRRQDGGATTAAQVGNHDSQITNHESPATSHPSQELRASQSPHFDPTAYAQFERATNDAVARDVRGSISDTLARVMPDGVADGAARRIGEDIFNEVHRALAADRTLSEQVASVLRDRRFGSGEQQRVASLLAGRAKQLVPSVARRVIGEWTSTVLDTARSKAARQAAAASRVDIAAPGGSLDSTPLRPRGAGSGRELNYSSMSDEEILGM